MAEPHRIEGSTVVVSGGCGFIGSHLVSALAARGARRIVVIDSLRYGKPENLEAGLPVEVVKHDLGFGDLAELERACAGADYLFHLAAEKHNQSKDDPTRVLRANVEGTAALLGAACRGGVKKLLFTSSLYAYGRLSGPPMVETEHPHPSTVYGISKLTGEHLTEFFARQHRIDWVNLRYFFVYGPRQFAGTGYKSVIVKSLERLLAGQSPIVNGDGQQALDYIYVGDAVEATCRALESPISGGLYNVGSGVATSVRDLIALMIRVSGKTVGVEAGPADFTAGSCRVGNVEEIHARLGFRAATSLEQGLTATLRWLEQTG